MRLLLVAVLSVAGMLAADPPKLQFVYPSVPNAGVVVAAPYGAAVVLGSQNRGGPIGVNGGCDIDLVSINSDSLAATPLASGNLDTGTTIRPTPP